MFNLTGKFREALLSKLNKHSEEKFAEWQLSLQNWLDVGWTENKIGVENEIYYALTLPKLFLKGTLYFLLIKWQI